MHRHLAKMVCLLVGGFAGWFVLKELCSIGLGGVTPPIFAGSTMLVIFLILYFPLARPMADIIEDRLEVTKHRGRHIKAGSGLDEIPEARPTVPVINSCQFCGGPDGPICEKCDQEIQ